MKHALAILTLLALAVPTTAVAKGPSAATMDGPGGGSITFSGDEGSGPLGQLTQQAGFFPAVFGQEPNPMLAGRPTGDLGPRYTITYTVPGPSGQIDRIRQDVYPYAKPSPVTYMEPGQTVFDGQQTRGGWFRAPAALKNTLVAAGLPATESTASASTSVRTELLALVAAALALSAATAVMLRRRARPTPA